jgi:sigma-B regulation protein RsbU (phosphoserine phosphatase)
MTELKATGLPLGLFPNAEYETRTAVLSPGGTLLVFTDGLTDSISGKNPENRLLAALADNPQQAMHNLKSLIDPKLNEDDVTIVLVKRGADTPNQCKLA